MLRVGNFPHSQHEPPSKLVHSCILTAKGCMVTVSTTGEAMSNGANPTTLQTAVSSAARPSRSELWETYNSIIRETGPYRLLGARPIAAAGLALSAPIAQW